MSSNNLKVKSSQGSKPNGPFPAVADDDGDSSFLGSTVKSLFGQCAGFVDVASFVIQSCRGDKDDERNKQGDTLGPLVEATRGRARRKQAGTLEFPAEGGFEDDVSALSANTLEEMERLARQRVNQSAMGRANCEKRNQPYPGQQLVAPPLSKVNDSQATDRPFSMQRSSSNADVSLGVATSGSSSTHDNLPVQNRDWQQPEGMRVFRAQVEI